MKYVCPACGEQAVDILHADEVVRRVPERAPPDSGIHLVGQTATVQPQTVAGDQMTEASKHFTWDELTRTDVRDLDNTPGPDAVWHLLDLASFLEEVRAFLKMPLRIYSAYRSPEVNARIGGAKTSQHMKGEACDFYPVGLAGKALLTCFDDLVHSPLDYDQIIYERPNPRNTGWIHISNVTYRQNRGAALTFTRESGALLYRPYHKMETP